MKPPRARIFSFATAARACVALLFGAVFALALGRCIPAPAPQPTYLPAASLQPVTARPQPRRFCQQFRPAAPPLEAVTCEDFATVAEGTLPTGWLGGEGLVVRNLGGAQALVPFERREVERLTATGFRALGDYQFDWALRLGSGARPHMSESYRIYVGSCVVTLRTLWEHRPTLVTLNQSEAPELPDLSGQAVHLSLRREGNVQRLLVNGRQLIVARYGVTETVDGFAVEVEGPGDYALLGFRLAAAPTPPAPPAPAAQQPAPSGTPPPAAQGGLPPIRSIAVGRQVCAQMQDLTVRCEPVPGERPGTVPGLLNVAFIRARGGTVCATDTDARHRCFGEGGWAEGSGGVDNPGPHALLPTGGELIAPADGANDTGVAPLVLHEGELTVARLTSAGAAPGRRLTFPGRVTQADQGPDTICAVLADRTVWCLSGAGRDIPVSGVAEASAVTIGWGNACAVLADFSVRCWGICHHGESEEGTPACRALERPRRRAALRSYPVTLPGRARSVAVLGGTAYAALEDGTVLRWDFDSRGRPSNVRPVGGLAGVQSLHGADEQVCAFHSDARVTCWSSWDPAARRDVRF